MSTDSISSQCSDEDDFRSKVMRLCEQTVPIPFTIQYSSTAYTDLDPIGRGTYSIVIKAFDKKINKPIVSKVIRVLSANTINTLNGLWFGGTENFEDVMSEIMTTRALSSLHEKSQSEYSTHTFPFVISSYLVHGDIPNYLILKQTNESMTHLEPFKGMAELTGAPKEYLVIKMKYCGDPINEYIKNKTITDIQLLSVAYQLIFALAVSETKFEFEHRDLHLNNILLKKTKKSHISFTIKSINYGVKCFNLKTVVIDNTFSRTKVDSNIYYRNLTHILEKIVEKQDPTAQDLIYRNMVRKTKNNWKSWCPKTNIYWLNYLFERMTTIVSSDSGINGNNGMNQQIKDTFKQMRNRIIKCDKVIEFIPKLKDIDKNNDLILFDKD